MTEEISVKLDKFFEKKNKNLHNPIFFGNELKYLKECLDDGYVSYVGKFVKKFEKKLSSYTKSKYVIATSSGTSALHLILNYIETNNNDEILLPAFTYVATANAIKYCNATPNFLDIDKDTLGVCPKKLNLYLKKISFKKDNKTLNKFTGKQIKALIIVHVYGMSCKISEIKKICKSYNIRLIEDAAEAVGSFYKGKHLGTFGDYGILSFNGNKTITTGGGGAILIENKKAANDLRHLCTHAKQKVKYDHFHDKVGFNYKMINLAAAVGCAQLENIKKILAAKRNNFKRYCEIFENYEHAEIFKEPKNCRSNHWLVTLIFKNTNKKKQFIRLFEKKKISLRYTWRPLNQLRIFRNCPSDQLENSKYIFNKSISLPSSPELSL